MRTPTLAVVAVFTLIVSQATYGVEWDTVKTASGTVKNTTVRTRNNNNIARNQQKGKNRNRDNYAVKPVYVEFSVDAPGMRIKFETKGTGERPSLKIDLEQKIERGDRTDWRRVTVVGRSRGDGSGGTIVANGPGEYRFAMTGQNTQYNITVEAPRRK